ncbi:MAG TPA: terminase small subunit [Chitinophagaceae bacterium]|nr:terminase small subunit [Chitinophagaceae bacterium]
MDLNDKQIKFCEEYLIDYNATQAAIRAGYSKKTAYSQAHDLLKKPEIQLYLANRFKKTASKMEITQERTMLEIGRIAFADVRKVFNEDGSLKSPGDWDDGIAAVIAGIDTEEKTFFDELLGGSTTIRTKKAKLWDKPKALEMLAKHFNLYSEAPVVNNFNLAGLSQADLKMLLALKKKVVK